MKCALLHTRLPDKLGCLQEFHPSVLVHHVLALGRRPFRPRPRTAVAAASVAAGSTLAPTHGSRFFFRRAWVCLFCF